MGKRKPKVKNNIEKSNDRVELEERELSPFAHIVLKEKKEEPKRVAPPPKRAVAAPTSSSAKKANEIVFGYDPNASFADILASYERTGNPYSAPKHSESKSQVKSFGEILAKWDSSSSPNKNKTKNIKKSEYKPTKSFAEIFATFTGEELREAEEEKVTAEENTTLRSQAIEPAKEAVNIAEERAEGEDDTSPIILYDEASEIVPEPNFFRDEDEESRRAPNAAWSIYGRNDSYIRPETEEIGEKEEAKAERVRSERAEAKRAKRKKGYRPTKAFSEILTSYENKRSSEEEAQAPSLDSHSSAEDGENEEPSLFKSESEEERRASNVAWSIYGGNSGFTRSEERDSKLPKLDEYQTRGAYSPTKPFDEILSSYKEIKTFDEIFKEKNGEVKVEHIPVSRLRSMNPQATLDLHGETKESAEKILSDFLTECYDNGVRKISIITGKGLHSADGVPVLREVTERVLRESQIVSEKSNAPQRAGGSGALWVILKAKDVLSTT